jgi:hypothetical protein
MIGIDATNVSINGRISGKKAQNNGATPDHSEFDVRAGAFDTPSRTSAYLIT